MGCQASVDGTAEDMLIRTPPHVIPKGKEGTQCPVTGRTLESEHFESAAEAKAAMDADPDISEEKTALKGKLDGKIGKETRVACDNFIASLPHGILPLNVINTKHIANEHTRRLVQNVGLPALRRFTNAFYQKAFADPHLDKFIASHNDPHGKRFALWIMEKFGDGMPWTEERRTRKQTLLRIGHETVKVSFDRSSAHFAAWHSPKREPHKWGQHFKPDDARVWMRLHFWAARETGMLDQHRQFMEYYTRFIGHFISVYSSKSPPFTRESLRWSADSQKTQRYVDAGNMMNDVIDVPLEEALADLPPEEREYSGSKSYNPTWPYDLAPLNYNY